MKNMLAISLIFLGVILALDGREYGRRRQRLPSGNVTTSNGLAKLSIITNIYDQRLHLNCSFEAGGRVRFEWKFDNRTLSRNERTKIRKHRFYSELLLRRPRRPHSGYYECIVTTNRSTIVTLGLFVIFRPPTAIRIDPNDVLLTTATGNFNWRCRSLHDLQVRNVSYSWYRKRLPDGEWRNVDSENELLTWEVPRRLHSTKDGYDVYDMYCEIKDGRQTTRSPLARFIVILPGTAESLGVCNEEEIDGIHWNETLVGFTASQNCIEDNVESGTATRVCSAFPGRPPRWRRPNLRDCRSPEFETIEDQLNALEEGFHVNISIRSALRELQTLTRRRAGRPLRLYGRDLLSTVNILERSDGFFRSGLVHTEINDETIDSFIEIASNLLHMENKNTWTDIDEISPNTAAGLVTSLEGFGFNVEEYLNITGDVIENSVQENLAFEVRHYNVMNDTEQEEYVFQQNNSKIILPQSIFNNSNSSSLTVVSVIYNTLASILGVVNVTGNSSVSGIFLLSGSQIISTTVKPLDSERFTEPVRIQLENNGSRLDSKTRKQCVFWNPDVSYSQWSDEGCRLVPEETTDVITTCECDHLTLFAVFVSRSGFLDSDHYKRLETISTIGSALSLAAILLTMIVYVYLWKALWSTRYVNFMNLCLAIALLNIFSVVRGAIGDDDEVPCEAVGVLLHYFVLALFLWMLCEGILLTMLITDVFKKEYGRNWYLSVHFIGWGVPAVIVAISIAIKGVSSYGREGHCWLSQEDGFLWAALGPMICVLLASHVVYGIMLRSVITSQRVQNEDTVGKIRATARASIIIMPVLGFAWIFAILDLFFDKLFLKYLFAIFNSLQGLFIFMFHCLLNKQVQRALKKSKQPPQRRSISDKTKSQEMRTTVVNSSQESLNRL